jgi:alpha-glucosidase (family GH31 glycosyl hydrolase)
MSFLNGIYWSDIGGFAEQPSGIYMRWIQLGFSSFLRTHSSGDHGDQEPWAFDEEIIDITRKFVNLRYQLLPYLYTMFWQYIEEGILCLNHLCITTKVIYKLIIETTNLFWKPNFSMSYFRTQCNR